MSEADPVEAAEREAIVAQPETDPVALALAQLDLSLARDVADPAGLLADLAAKLREVESALAPRRRTKAAATAATNLKAAREALKVKGLGALDEVRRAATEYRKAHGLPPPAKPRRRFGLAAALEDRPPPKSVCRKLEWEVGRPPMIIGPPGAAKTYAIQAAILDLVLGRSLWGNPEFRPPGPCRCLHIDLDQGADKSLRRYRRLLAGLGVFARDESQARRELAILEQIHPSDLGAFDVDQGDGLALMSLQPEETARWKAAWIEAVRGYDVAFVDSLRRLAPFLDENDSRFSMVPDMLRTVSETAQCVIILLHHASNKGRDKAGKPLPAATRGSSAIDGAAGTQLAIDREKDLRKVTQIRAGEAAEIDAFYLAFENDEAPGPGGVRGVRLRYRTAEQAKAPERDAKAARLRAIADKVLLFVRKHNATKQCCVPGRRTVCENIEGARDTVIYAAIQLLVDEGKLVEDMQKEGGKKVPRIWATQEGTGT